jgi:dihydropteroate synthase
MIHSPGAPEVLLTDIFLPRLWRIRDRVLSNEDHTLVMGIVNVTPDSFSDGGTHETHREAIAHGLELWDQGADIVDVGGESTRPGATPVAAADEIDRVTPVVAALVERGVVVSIDTMKATVAAAAIAAGAHIVNDITALADPDMAPLCAESEVAVILMHMQGTPQTMQDDPSYADVVAEVLEYLESRARVATDNGINTDRIVIDPGIGFGKQFEHNLSLLGGVARFVATGFPVLIGTSRKGLLGQILRDAGFEVPAADRDAATASTVALAIAAGATIVRVHNVGHGVQAARTADAMVRAPLRR